MAPAAPRPQIPELVARPHSYASPFSQYEVAKLEPIHQPLYSACALPDGALPDQNVLFTYAVGQQVTGFTNLPASLQTATKLHTNMETAAFLAAPKLFLITGVRTVMNQLDWTADPAVDPDPSGHAVAAAVRDTLDAMKLLLYTSTISFRVGNKDYLEAPLWDAPGNTGIDGVAAAATTVAASSLEPTAFHSRGRYFALDRFPVLVRTQQTFSMTLRHHIAVSMPETFLFYGVFDGILGREVM